MWSKIWIWTYAMLSGFNNCKWIKLNEYGFISYKTIVLKWNKMLIVIVFVLQHPISNLN
ncbi:MAG: hypothetical protein H0W88_05870 [Parachlamydiaceae bacterium]|nr:hypothetical protein [Parachlamydiaceae bacterium]